jgi:protein-serine/threonine kinase
MAPPPRTGSQASVKSNPNFSSSSYASSFPILNPASALNPAAHTHEGRKTVIRTGHANVKEEGLRSFLWSKRWLVLGGTDLQIFKNEVSFLALTPIG